MNKIETDILVAGGGVAGMLASLILAQSGFSVICVDASPKPDKTTRPDQRSTAFLMPSIALLSEAGIFGDLETIAEPLRVMRIVDAGGPEFLPVQISDFEAHEAGEEQFGFNIPNAPLREHLLNQIEAHPRIEMRFGDGVSGFTPRLTSAITRLASGAQIFSKLVIGADGRSSKLRDLAKIDVTTLRYGQKAIVFAAEHQEPHFGISTEIHRSGGPFTLVPVAGFEQKRSAVVWMDHGAETQSRMELTDAAFEAALNLRSCGVMGPLTLASKRAMWPIISQFAHSLIGQRLALMGEAAHVVPPIGAQGLNMSLADVSCLRDLITADNLGDIGSDQVLERYEKERLLKMKARVSGIDALNRASMAGSKPAKDLRASLLSVLDRTPYLRTSAIKAGLGRLA